MKHVLSFTGVLTNDPAMYKPVYLLFMVDRPYSSLKDLPISA